MAVWDFVLANLFIRFRPPQMLISCSGGGWFVGRITFSLWNVCSHVSSPSSPSSPQSREPVWSAVYTMMWVRRPFRGNPNPDRRILPLTGICNPATCYAKTCHLNQLGLRINFNVSANDRLAQIDKGATFTNSATYPGDYCGRILNVVG